MLEILTSPENWIALFTLTALEIVLGIDNIVFIALLTGRVEPERQAAARRIGLLAAMGMRILLLLAISWVMGLTTELFHLLGHGVSGRDIILLGGGLFLIAKATFEIHERIEEAEHPAHRSLRTKAASFGAVIVQIMLLDIVFSLDSVITAVGMAKHIPIMVAAVVIAVGVMMLFAGTVSDFIHRNPSMKILALSFLLMIGMMLVAEGVGKEIEKGYIYFAMGFSLFVELVNIRIAQKRRDANEQASVPA